jgi:hypothetical protein
MVFTRKSFKKFTKGAIKGIRKAMNVGESVVNQIDKASGGALRQMAATATGGLSETVLKAYNKNKGAIKKGLDLAEGKKNATVADVVQGTALQKPFDQAASTLKRYEPVARNIGSQNKEVGKVIKSYDDNIRNKLGVY